tara:strand:+ start:525 stop:1400 length:876 start_codon:yes stop_codon:yes gene_type:complete
MGGIKVITTDPKKLSSKNQELNKSGRNNRDVSQGFRNPKPKPASNMQVAASLNGADATIGMCWDRKYPKHGTIELRAGTMLRTEKTDKGEPLTVPVQSPISSARLTLCQATDDTNIKSARGKFNFRAAIDGKADTVKLHGRETVEIASGGSKYRGNGSKIMAPAGGINLIAGNRAHGGSYQLQKMVKGDNLVACLEEMMTFVNRTAEVQRAIIQDINKLKIALTFHVHIAPLIGPTSPSPDLAAQIGMSMPGGLMDIANNASTSVNNEIQKVNWLKPTSPTYILSRFNKVN